MQLAFKTNHQHHHQRGGASRALPLAQRPRIHAPHAARARVQQQQLLQRKHRRSQWSSSPTTCSSTSSTTNNPATTTSSSSSSSSSRGSRLQQGARTLLASFAACCAGAAATAASATAAAAAAGASAAGPQPHELLQLALFLDTPKTHWLATVLLIGAVNILGLQAVLKLLQASRDSSTPVTVLAVRMGVRTDNGAAGSRLQERLRYLRGMMPATEGQMSMFFTLEEAIRTIVSPPRGCQLAFADVTALPLGSKQAGYEKFKQLAVREEARAEQEEAQQVLHGMKPAGPQHRSMLQKLLGAEETQDAEERQACLLVTFVLLARGTYSLPPQPLQSGAAFRETMKSLCGHISSGQLLALEMLLTPDDPADFLSEAQLLSDYSFLTDLSSGLREDAPEWTPSPLASLDAADGSGGSSGGQGGGSAQAAAAAAALAAMAGGGAGAEAAAAAAAAAAGAEADGAAQQQQQRRVMG